MPSRKTFLTWFLNRATVSVVLLLFLGSVDVEACVQAEGDEGLAVFFFESEVADPEVTWLQYGIPLALAMDLRQDPNLDVRSVPMFVDRLRRMGFSELVGVAYSSGRVLSREQQQSWFVLGRVARQDGAIRVDVALHPTRAFGSVREHTFVGEDALSLVDQISAQLREDVGLPTLEGAAGADRPVAELLTEDSQAFRQYAEGVREALVSQDVARAVSLMEAAVEEDRGFVAALHSLSGLYIEMGRIADASAVLDAAMSQLDRIPERDRFQVRADYHWVVETSSAEALRQFEAWADLYPRDVLAYHGQARIHSEVGDHDRALASLEAAFESGSSETSALYHLGDVWLARGDTSAALTYYREYANREPEWKGVFSANADRSRSGGNLEGAKIQYQRSVLLAPTDPGAWTDLAIIEAGLGDPELAISLYEEGVARAETREGRVQALESLGSHLLGMGRSGRGMTYIEQGFEEAAEFSTDVELSRRKLDLVGVLVAAGRDAAVSAIIEEARNKYPDDLEGALAAAGVSLFLEFGPADSLEAAYRVYQATYPTPEGEAESANDHFYAAMIHEHRGEWREAIQRWEARKETGFQDPSFGMSIGPCYRELGEYGQAVNYIQEAIDFFPYGPRTNLEIALTYEAMGRLEDARMHLGRTMRWYSEADSFHRYAQRARELAERIGLEF